MAHDVFISHSSKDRVFASAVCAALEAEKIRCWVAPRDIKPGQSWAEAITEAIEKSSVMVLIFSSNSNNSKDVLKEITLAVNSGVFILPLRIEYIEPKGAIKYYLSDLHWLDAINPLTEKQIRELVERIKPIIETSSPEKPPKAPLVIKPEKKEDKKETVKLKVSRWRGLTKKQRVGIIVSPIIIAISIFLIINFMIGIRVPNVETPEKNELVKKVEEAIPEEEAPSEEEALDESEIEEIVEDTATEAKIAFNSYRDGNYEIYIMNIDGSEQRRLTNNPAGDWVSSFSPDGSKIAFASNRDGNDEIYIMNVDGTEQTRLTDNPAYDREPCFSPDGSKIVFVSKRYRNCEIYIMNVDGTGQVNLTDNPADDGGPFFSPDGSKIAFVSKRYGSYEICIMNVNGSGQTRLIDNLAFDVQPCFSPDGSKIAFVSNRDGNNEIYIMNVDGTGQVNLTSNPAYDREPCFSPDRSKIAFASDRDGNSEIYIMNVDGTEQTRLTDNPAGDGGPCFSP